jgi:hypothetical protein
LTLLRYTAVRASLRPHVSASDTVLGLALAICRRHSFLIGAGILFNKRLADCAGTLNEGEGKVCEVSLSWVEDVYSPASHRESLRAEGLFLEACSNRGD